jgi:hypothetical protein
MKNAAPRKELFTFLFLCFAIPIACHGQTFINLVTFNLNNGALPFYGALIQGPDGNYYGTTAIGPGGTVRFSQ